MCLHSGTQKPLSYAGMKGVFVAVHPKELPVAGPVGVIERSLYFFDVSISVSI